MPHIELPRALENYFAYAETEPTASGRRFTITLPYYDGEDLDRLQWWWEFKTVQQKLLGDEGLATLRQQAIDRFRRHIERWLENTGQRLHGDEPIPRIGPALVDEAPAEPAWPAEKVANG